MSSDRRASRQHGKQSAHHDQNQGGDRQRRQTRRETYPGQCRKGVAPNSADPGNILVAASDTTPASTSKCNQTSATPPRLPGRARGHPGPPATRPFPLATSAPQTPPAPARRRRCGPGWPASTGPPVLLLGQHRRMPKRPLRRLTAQPALLEQVVHHRQQRRVRRLPHRAHLVQHLLHRGRLPTRRVAGPWRHTESSWKLSSWDGGAAGAIARATFANPHRTPTRDDERHER
jgi:hypothetical protein